MTQGVQQLTIDGAEVPALPKMRNAAGLSSAQRAILRHIAQEGSIRAFEAGTIVHEHRNRRCWRKSASATKDRHRSGQGCCAYASTDGSSALTRLAARGFVVRGERRGVWVAPGGSREP